MGMITVVENKAVLSPEACTQIVEIERAKKALDDKEKALRDLIKAEMEEKGYKSFETDEFSITYKAPYDSENFDKKAFRAEHRDLYDSYVSMKTVSSSITIKLK